jgi:PAS domain S-box-containing protein
MHVLLVDDDEVDRMAVIRALRDAAPGISVTETSNADAAMEALREGRFDCVVSDLHMPGHDGAWLLDATRREALDVPIVVLTGQGDEQVAVAMMKRGAADYVNKSSMRASDIADALRHAVRVHRAERDARLAAQALRASEERLRLAMETTGLSAWDWNVETGEVTYDPRFTAMLGARAGVKLTPNDWREGIHPNDRERVNAAVDGALDPAGDGRYDVEYRFRGLDDGVERWLRGTGKVLFQDGKAARFVGTLLDVTRPRQQQELAQRRLEFEQQLIGIVSHDLRSPIAAMVMGAGALKHRLPSDSPLASIASRIVSSGDRATRLIHDLLDFTKVRAGQGMPIARRSSDIHSVCRHAVDELSVNHPDRVIVHDRDGEGHGLMDPDRISQVVSNLTRNALTYSPPGTPVTVRSRGQERGLALEVHNVGPPIPEEIIPTLFEPFKRGEHRLDADRSIGLGLFIVREIVAAHGGGVRVRSTAGEGTTFHVELPRLL